MLPVRPGPRARPAPGEQPRPLTRDAGDARHGGSAARESRRVDERLERRPRLASREGRPVEGKSTEVGAAHERKKIAGPRIDRDEGRLQARVGETREPLGNGSLRGPLQGDPEGGADAPADRVTRRRPAAERRAAGTPGRSPRA